MAGPVVELSNFLGDWSDSLGNHVHVWDSGRATQVRLTKPDESGKEILLAIKKVGANSFLCGHYEFDERQSSCNEICWRDKRDHSRITVWRRKDGVPPPPWNPAAVGGAVIAGSPHTGGTSACGQPQAAVWSCSPAGAPNGVPSPGVIAVTPAASTINTAQAAWSPTAQALLGPTAQALLGHQDDETGLGACASGGSWGATGSGHHIVIPPSQHRLQILAPQQQQQLFQSPAGAQPPNTWCAAASQQHGGPVRVAPPPWAPGTNASTAQAAITGGQAPWQSAVVPPWQQATGALAPWASAGAGQEQKPASHDDDWSHVLSVLAAAREESKAPASSGATGTQADAAGLAKERSPSGDTADLASSGAKDATKGSGEPEDSEEGAAARWNEVLELLTEATGGSGGGSTQGGVVSHGPGRAGGGQIDTLFSGFGMQQAPVFEQASEEVRAQVLQETLARLLQQKTGGALQANSSPEGQGGGRVIPPPPWSRRTSASDPYAGVGEDFDFGTTGGDDVPDWQRSGSTAGVAAQRKEVFAMGAEPILPPTKIEGPLDKFIRVFNLDELAAKCLRALEDDEVAFVIESCQGRLRFARNPSAVVMIAIRGVAAKVGRRYYGSRYNSELQKLLEQHSQREGNKSDVKELQFFCGSPSPEAEAGEACDTAEDAAPDDGDVSLGKRKDGPEADASGKRPRTDDISGGVEVLGASPDEKEEDDEDDAGLFFVDTGGR